MRASSALERTPPKVIGWSKDERYVFVSEIAVPDGCGMVFVDDIIGYVHEAWWYKYGSRYMKDEGFRKKVAKRFGNVKKSYYI